MDCHKEIFTGGVNSAGNKILIGYRFGECSGHSSHPRVAHQFGEVAKVAEDV